MYLCDDVLDSRNLPFVVLFQPLKMIGGKGHVVKWAPKEERLTHHAA